MNFKKNLFGLKDLGFSVTAKNFYWVSGGNLLIVFSGFLFTVIVARALSPSDLGLFSTITSIILVISDFGELGINSGLSNFLPSFLKNNDKLNSRRIIKTAFLFQLAISVILSLILIVFYRFLNQLIFPTLHLDHNFLYFIVFGIVGFMMFNFVSGVIVAQEKFRNTFIIQNLYSLSKIIFILILWKFFKLNVLLILGVFVISPMLAFCGGILLTGLAFLRTSGFYSFKKLLGFSLFLALNKVFVTLFSKLDIIMLSSLASTYDSGIYSAASRVALFYPLIGGSLGTIINPKFARLSLEEVTSFGKKAFLLVALLIFSLLLMIVLSPFIIPFIFGEKYLPAIPVLQALLVATIPFLLSIPTNSMITYVFKKPYVLVVSSLIQLMIILTANFILIPKLGSFAPAVSGGLASFIAMLISFASVFIFSHKKNG